MDRLDELSLLLAIVDSGSFVAGGRQFNRSASSATRIIGEMEHRLGVRLLHRTTRKLSLTASGAELVERARRLLTDYDEAINQTVGQAKGFHGRISLSAPILFGRRFVAPLVSEFLNLHQDIEIELSLEDRLADLIEERVDVALRIGHLQNSSLVSKRVGQVRRIVVASPEYLSKHGTPRSPEDIVRHQAVMFINQANAPAWSFQRRDLSEEKITPPGRLQVNSAEAAITLAKEGKGLARILSYQVASELKDGSLVCLLKDYELPPVPVQLVYPTARLLARRVREFLDFAAAGLTPLVFNRI